MDVKLLIATLPEGTKLAPWCRKLGISRQTAYKWRARYRAEGLAGLEDRSRAPSNPGGRCDAAVEDGVVSMRKRLLDSGLDAGHDSIHSYLQRQGEPVPSRSTVYRILVRRGQITPQPAKRPKATYRRWERSRPNECWQGDDTHYRLSTGQEAKIINLLDDHSRLNVDSLAVLRCTSARVWECFTRAAERFGLPAEFLNDNGTQWISRDGSAPTAFQAHLGRLGVRQIHSRPYHPQTCGKVERFHQTQRKWLDAQPQATTVTELQALLDEFRAFYNNERPHRALRRRTPAEVWAAQPPASPARPADQPEVMVRAARVDAAGILPLGRSLRVGVGAEWTHAHLTAIRRGNELTIIATNTGEIIRELTIDLTRNYQPTGRPRGGSHRPRRNV